MKDKICLICHTVIDTEREYCEFKHFEKKNKIKSKAYYHVECFKRRLAGSTTQERLAKQGFDLIKLTREKMGIENKKRLL